MPVPLPTMCAVLAHELRSPLSVIQGYIRLLQRQRDAGHPEAAMLDAMLDATGRLTGIARQASDLGAWLTGPGAAPLPTHPVSEIVARLAGRFGADSPIAATVHPVSAAVGDQLLRCDPPALVDALSAVVDALHREAGGAPVEIALADPEATGVVTIRLQAHGQGHARPFSFERGGSGLALVTASHVLTAHGAIVEPAAGDGLTITFPHTGGIQ